MNNVPTVRRKYFNVESIGDPKTQALILIAIELNNRWEIGNAFSAMLRRERVTLPQAQTAIAAYQQIPIRFVEIEMNQALDIAATFNIYAYDAYLIRCATKYRAPLLTLDRHLMQVAEDAGVKILEA